MPPFSVVIPTFNRLALLQRTLESVWSQRFADYEVIVVDDGSTDGTVEYLRQCGGRVRVIEQSNRGPGAARNAGAAAAQGRYLTFLDSDDVWFPWSLETYAAAIQQHDSPAFIAGKPFRFGHDEQLASVSAAAMNCQRFEDYLASGDEWRWWGASSFVICTEKFRACGGFSENNINGEDADLAMKLGLAPGFLQVIAPATFGYREHATNVTADLSKSIAGVWHMIHAEQSGGYVGGPGRALRRWLILTRFVRTVALNCAQQHRKADAWKLYRATFRWHCALRRWKFLLCFPVKAILS